MRFDVEDITLIAAARRQAGLSLRLMRSVYRVLFFILSFFLAAFAIGVARTASSDGALAAWSALRSGIISFSTYDAWYANPFLLAPPMALLLFLTVRGSRIACLMSAAFYGWQLVVALGNLGVDLYYGFETHDFREIGRYTNPLNQEFTNDLRALPLRLYGILGLILVVVMFWRVGKVQELPGLRRANEFRKLILEDPGELRPLAWLLRDWKKFRFIHVKVAAAMLAYVLYSLLMTIGTRQVLYLIQPSSQLKMLALMAARRFSDVEMYLWGAVLLVMALAQGWFLFWLGTWCLRGSRRLAIMGADELLGVDARSPVLYLRSFRSDVIATSERRSMGLLAFLDPFRMTARLAQLIAARAAPIGPVVMIADPHAKISLPGPAPKIPGERKWHDVVLELMVRARLIIVFMDTTENLIWEIETLQWLGVFDRALFVFGPPIAGKGASEHAQELARIAKTVMLKGYDMPAGAFDQPGNVRAMMVKQDRIRVLTSRTATIADYEVALGMMLDPLISDRGSLLAAKVDALVPAPQA